MLERDDLKRKLISLQRETDRCVCPLGMALNTNSSKRDRRSQKRMRQSGARAGQDHGRTGGQQTAAGVERRSGEDAATDQDAGGGTCLAWIIRLDHLKQDELREERNRSKEEQAALRHELVTLTDNLDKSKQTIIDLR